MDTVRDLLNSFKTALAADKKKTVLMCGLLVALLVMVGRLVFFSRTPKPAQAASPIVVTASARGSRAEVRVRPVAETTAPPAQTRRAVVGSLNAEPRHDDMASVLQGKVVSIDGLPRTLSRNIFNTPAWHSFATVSSPSGSGADGKSKSKPRGLFAGFIERLASYQQSRRQEEKRIEDALSRLKLESTVTGSEPLAYISGRLLREGQRIDGFSVVRIMDRRVMLRKSGITLVLNMP